MARSECLYDLLGVADDATEDELKRAYRDAARMHHPDVNPDAEPGRFSAVSSAYDVLRDPSGNLVKDTTGICWGEILKNPKYPNGEFESIFWVKESNCVYGELSQSQLNKLGSRGKAAKITSPYLKKEIGLN